MGVPQFPQTLPADTVVGRLGIGPGPAQAIPFETAFDRAITVAVSPAGIEFVADGGGAVLTTGLKAFLEVPFAATIKSARLFADRAGSIVIDIWKCTFSQFDAGATHPVIGDSITAGTPPTITAATKSQDTTLASWGITLNAGDILGFSILSANTVRRVTLSLDLSRGAATATSFFSTRTDAVAAIIASDVTWLQTEGYYTPGDNGGALYTKTTGLTTGGFQSLDGQYWAVAETDRPMPQMFGAKADGLNDDAQAIQDAHDYISGSVGGYVYFPPGVYMIGQQLNFVSSVGIQGAGRSNTIISATFAGIMLLWTGGTGAFGASSIQDISFQGNDIATVGVLVGNDQNFFMKQVQIEHCFSDGLVLAGTQNSMFHQVFVQNCALSDFRLAGLALNNNFIRCGSNDPGSSGYHLLSRISAGYLTLANPILVPGNNRHNTWLHPIFERATPINLIRLEDDEGGNAFMYAELNAGSAGNPQVYIGALSADTIFFGGNIQSGGVAGNGLSYAFDNFGFNTMIVKVAGIGWVGANWINNTAPGTIYVEDASGAGTINDPANRAFETSDAFSGGRLGHYLESFGFFRNGNDGTSLGPLLSASGNIAPSAANTYNCGSVARPWAQLNATLTIQQTAFINSTTFAGLPALAAGQIAHITDSTVNAIGAVVAGGGGFRVLIWCNGLNWSVLGA